MNKKKVSLKKRMRRSGILAFLLLLCGITPAYTWVDKSAFQSESTEVVGLTDYNNVEFVEGRYIITAPYAPGKPVTTATRLEDLDNNQLFVYDGKKLGNEPLRYSLNNCYFPTRVWFDKESSTVFIRCTQISEKDGELESQAVIKYVHLNLDDNGKPVFDTTAPVIPIPEVKTGVPSNNLLSNDDLLFSDATMVFHNGASIFTFSLLKGFIYKVDFIAPGDFDPVKNAITYLGLDKDSNTLTVITNKKVQGEDKSWKHYSELYFYRLNHDGTMDQLNRVKPDAFPQGVSLPAGSNVAINSDGELKEQGAAYFVGSDGVFYETRWHKGDEVFGSLEALTSFASLQQDNGEYLSSVNTYYNKDSKTFEIVKNGFTSYIHRPANAGGRGRIGKIHRPANLRLSVGTAALALAQMGKKNKIVSQAEITEGLGEQNGLLNPFSDDQGKRYLATYSGNVYELNNAQDVDSASITLLGKLGNRLANVTYSPEREWFVAINSLETDEASGEILSPGGLLLARRQVANNYLSFLEWLPERSPFVQPVAFSIGSIRRPCNIGLH